MLKWIHHIAMVWQQDLSVPTSGVVVSKVNSVKVEDI